MKRNRPITREPFIRQLGKPQPAQQNDQATTLAIGEECLKGDCGKGDVTTLAIGEEAASG
jgi:hypothetical protein